MGISVPRIVDMRQQPSEEQCELILDLTQMIAKANLPRAELCEVFGALIKTCPLISPKEIAIIGRDILREFTREPPECWGFMN
mgnify:CR=1 FL=1